MKDNTVQNGSTRMGVKVMNVVVRPDNCFMHLKAMCDLKVGRFVFKKVRFSRGWGQDPVIRLPWKAKRVSIPDWDYLTKLNEDIRKQFDKEFTKIEKSPDIIQMTPEVKKKWGIPVNK